MKKLKAIFHVNETENWKKTLINVTNFVNDVGEGNAEVEILANGAAVLFYTGEEEDRYEQMKRLAGRGVQFLACRNALKMHSLGEESLYPFVRTVPAGITEIVRRQGEGFAYIKP
ncbi:MAG: DsrE family protein [Firmicutes bacterium]|nr:DsrE family protein [Bacillota bacterium]